MHAMYIFLCFLYIYYGIVWGLGINRLHRRHVKIGRERNEV